MNSFADKLRALEQASRVRQREIARRLGISVRQLTNYLNGSRQPELTNLIALIVSLELPDRYEDDIMELLEMAGFGLDALLTPELDAETELGLRLRFIELILRCLEAEVTRLKDSAYQLSTKEQKLLEVLYQFLGTSRVAAREIRLPEVVP